MLPTPRRVAYIRVWLVIVKLLHVSSCVFLVCFFTNINSCAKVSQKQTVQALGPGEAPPHLKGRAHPGDVVGSSWKHSSVG